MRYKSLFLPAAFLIWVAAIFTFSSESYHTQTIVPFLRKHWTAGQLSGVLPDVRFTYNGHRYSARQDPYSFIEFLFRKGAHLFLYAGAGALILLLLGSAAASLWKRVPLTLALTAAIASADEWNQTRAIGRTSTVYDVWLDTTGAMIGVIAILIYCRSSPSRRGRNGSQELEKGLKK
jgi:VanZ family protein